MTALIDVTPGWIAEMAAMVAAEFAAFAVATAGLICWMRSPGRHRDPEPPVLLDEDDDDVTAVGDAIDLPDGRDHSWPAMAPCVADDPALYPVAVQVAGLLPAPVGETSVPRHAAVEHFPTIDDTAAMDALRIVTGGGAL